MDNVVYQLLGTMDLQNTELISLAEFEDPDLLSIKRTRTVEEYCWTCTPSLPLYIMKQHPDLNTISYLDADLFFFSSPEPIYEEFGDRSIMIIPHRFPKERDDLLEKAGIYNVSMLAFRNDRNSFECLRWWRDKCIEWCFRESEDGRLGDQKYLDDWPQRFFKVHVLRHKGANVGPWNLYRYDIRTADNRIFVDEIPLVFYHFHAVELYADSRFRLHTFLSDISLRNKQTIYGPYLRALEYAMRTVKTVEPSFDHGLGPTVSPIKKAILTNERLLTAYTLLWKTPATRRFLKLARTIIYGKSIS